ncbi:MAG: TonB-dependent receptor [Chitinophagaceae bacterium]|nr:TonB-dependent receptor [Chitinophagaceae bacterium]
MKASTLLIFFCSLIVSTIGSTQIPFRKNSVDTTLPQIRILDEVIVTASKTKEKLLKSPISIQKLGDTYFKSSSAPSFFDALENVQGIQMITPSLGFKVINARGFANTTNVRFSQLVDGMDVQSPHIGGPIGNSLGPTDLDIKDVEIIPGVASALYGMNTINGLANFKTKNPFDYEGLSLAQKTGITHIGDSNSSARLFTETSLRYAKKMSSRFAFKLNFSFNKGYDWIADNRTELNPNANSSTNLFGYNNPAQDPVNVYGNESSNRKTITLMGKSYVVARTGYAEKDVTNYNLQNSKGDIALYYKFKNQSSLTYTYHFALLNSVYQRSNRFSLQNYLVQQHGLEFQSNWISFKLYTNSENTGSSYNLRSMAENLDRSYKSDNSWYKDYGNAFNAAIANGSNVASSHQLARTAADAGRYLPDNPSFTSELEKLQNINNWDSGAALRVVARFIHSEAQFDLVEKLFHSLKEKGTNLYIGLDSRTYIIKPDGNYFINPIVGKTNENIYSSKTGGYISYNQSVLSNKLRIGSTLRIDKTDYFDATVSPRITLVYSTNQNTSFRFAYQEGFRYPSIFEAYSNINSGGVKRVGGLPIMSSGVFENAWLANSISSFQSSVLSDINKNGLSKNDAILKEKYLLQKSPYTYIKPENIRSLETGFRGSILRDKLYIDADFYYNIYHNFIAQTNENVPLTAIADSIPFALYDKTLQRQYRVWTNSKSTVYNYGTSFGLTYISENGIRTNANTTYSKLQKSVNEDGLEDGFNTPSWMVNLSFSKQHIYKTLGGGIGYKWQSAYYLQSFLVNGNVPAYGTIDGNLNYQIPKTKWSLKLSATNLLNKYYYSFLGGPSIGGMYYLSILYL